MHRLAAFPGLLTVISLLMMLLVISGCSTLGEQPRNKAEVISTTGATVALFYGGSKEASSVFCVGETVPVYRQESRTRLRYVEVGKIRIMRVVNENYLEGEVVEGSVKPGYFARKGNLSCLVTQPEPAEAGD